MRLVALVAVLAASLAARVDAASPFVHGKIFYENKESGASVEDSKPVYGCCESTKLDAETCPEDLDEEHHRLLAKVQIGTMPQMTSEQALEVLESSVGAWNGGSGVWPQMSLSDRISSVQSFLAELQHKREEIVQVLMFEIGKNRKDAESEFDRTIKFAEQTIDFIKSSGEYGSWDASNGSTRLFLSRAAVGVVMTLAPYNYPLNESYAALIPALLMGNVVILKVPTIGGLAHMLTMDAISKTLPPGTLNFISGSGRKTMPPLMRTGKIDSLAFIGGSRAADDLIKAHPEPHRLKLFLQLEAKNMGVFMPNLFGEDVDDSELENALKETITGTLSFNGQRCTALKLLFVPKVHSEDFANRLAKKVESLSVGLPHEHVEGKFSSITPLPGRGRIDYMRMLIEDAIEKGARIVKKNGGMVVGEGDANESTLMVPAVLYPVKRGMKIYEEEQFGPVVPVAPYDSIDEVEEYARTGQYGQQVSIFTSKSNGALSGSLVDKFSTVFGKININSQCGRSPDTAPFSGRRSSALGTMSVSHALMEFSIPTVVSYKDVGSNTEIVQDIEKNSRFMETI